jgi:Uma2 family endonuclease
LTRQLANWNRAEQRGKTFDSSTGFSLSNGACYSPDAAWVRLVRWNALTADQREQYPPLSPDLAIELISASDDFRVLPGKLRDYIACGSRVALSLDPYRRLVTIVTVDREPLELSDPAFVDLAPFGEDFSGLTLDVRAIFEASPPQHSSD